MCSRLTSPSPHAAPRARARPGAPIQQVRAHRRLVLLPAGWTHRPALYPAVGCEACRKEARSNFGRNNPGLIETNSNLVDTNPILVEPAPIWPKSSPFWPEPTCASPTPPNFARMAKSPPISSKQVHAAEPNQTWSKPSQVRPRPTYVVCRAHLLAWSNPPRVSSMLSRPPRLSLRPPSTSRNLIEDWSRPRRC